MTSGLGLFQPVPSRVGTQSLLAQDLRRNTGADGATFEQFLRDAGENRLAETRARKPIEDEPDREARGRVSASHDQDDPKSGRVDEQAEPDESGQDRPGDEAERAAEDDADRSEGTRSAPEGESDRSGPADQDDAADDDQNAAPTGVGEQEPTEPAVGDFGADVATPEGPEAAPREPDVDGAETPSQAAGGAGIDSGAAIGGAAGTEDAAAQQDFSRAHAPSKADAPPANATAGAPSDAESQSAGVVRMERGAAPAASGASESWGEHSPTGSSEPSRTRQLQDEGLQPPKGVTEAKFAKTRFNDSVRVQVREAARVDLDEIAAAELRSPTERSGVSGRASGSTVPLWDVRGEPEPDESVERRAGARAPVPDLSRPRDAGQRPEQEPRTVAANPQSASASPDSPGSAEHAGRAREGNAGTSGGADAPAARMRAAPAVAGAASAPVFRVTGQPASVVGDSKGVSRASEAGRAGAKPATPQQSSESGETAKRVLAQVSRGFASVLRHKGGSLTLRLSPQSLGEVKIKVQMQGGSVQASFRPSGAQARELLKDNMSSLRESLERSGVRVERLQVEDSPRDAVRLAAEPRTPGDGSPEQQSPADSGEDGRSPGGGRHGGRQDRHGGGRDSALDSNRHDRGGGAGASSDGDGDDRLVGVGGGLSLDTFA